MRELGKPRGAANAPGLQKRRTGSPSLRDLESIWQGIAWRFESHGARVPLRWRMIRRVVGLVFQAGERGWF